MLCGLRQGPRTREANKKKALATSPLAAPITFSEKIKTKRSFSLASPLQVFSSSPQPPSPPLGKFFVFPILWLVSDLMYIICLFKQLRILSGGAERHVCSLAYLIMLKSSVFFFPPYFCSEPIFGTLSISVHTTVGSLIHVPSFQKQLSVCINITLTMASIIRISQEKNNKNVKGAFSKITTQLATSDQTV